MVRAPFSSTEFSHRWASITGAALVCISLVGFQSRAEAHGISEASSETMADGGILEYIWLGAEHMVTGYDHLLFLFGVIFFLTGFRDVVRFITAFTLGHCITLLGATLAGVTANAHLIDAIIALSVIYKGFENLDGFEKALHIRPPNLLAMVFIFGLIHGFGLSTRLQELPLGDDGLISRILAFNVGVELGQVAALTVMLGFFKIWRASRTFERFSNVANSILVLAGVGLFIYQVDGYIHETAHVVSHAEGEAEHGAQDHDHDPSADHDHDPSADHDHENDADHDHEADPDPEALANPNPTDPEPSPDDAAHEEPAEKDHGHGHSHSHGHAQEQVNKANDEPVEAPVEEKKSHGHSHESGGTHTH
jgi:hydrogenase/urease accessory protein HupE